jgi:hypothetical protein
MNFEFKNKAGHTLDKDWPYLGLYKIYHLMDFYFRIRQLDHFAY